MAHTHEFDCKACGAHIDSSEELERHKREKHPGQQASRGSGTQASDARSALSPSDERPRRS